MKSRILFFCFLVAILSAQSFAQETSATFSPVAIVTAEQTYDTQYGTWGNTTFSDGNYPPNPVGTYTFQRYRTGISFEITSVPSYAYITKADFTINVTKPAGSWGSSLSMNKMSQKVDSYNASTFWSNVGSGDNFSTVSVGSQTISFETGGDFTNYLRSALTGNGTVNLGFLSNSEANDGSIVNINSPSPSLKVYYQNPGVTVKNNFGGTSTGTLKVDGTQYNSGVPFYWAPYEYHTAEAIDQSYNNHAWTFKEWRKNGSFYSSQRSVSISSVANQKETIYEAAFEMAYNVTVRNSFDAGNVKVDGVQVSSGATFSWASGSTHTLEAIDRQYIQDLGNNQWYYRIYQTWQKNSEQPSGTNPRTITVDGDATYTANFKKEFNVNFTTNLPNGQIRVNGVDYTSSTPSFPVVQDQTITAEALPTSQTVDYIDYTFSSWSNGSTLASTTFTPGDHATYTANYAAKPTPTPNVTVGGPANTYVVATWSEHPNQYVTQYQIWRIVKHNGVVSDPVLLATKPRGTTSYTDREYLNTSGYTDDLLRYDVQAYYEPAASYSDPNWIVVYAKEGLAKMAENESNISLDTPLPKDFAISSFPNPFNPSTTISYQLVEDANVQLKIYDVMGREIATLVDAQKQAGYHSVQWSGKDSRGAQVSSGVYLYRFTASPTNGAKLFTASGKLLLAK